MSDKWQVEVILTKPDGSRIATNTATHDPADLVSGIRENAEAVIRKWEFENASV